MNIFTVYGYVTSNTYSANSITSVGPFALIVSGSAPPPPPPPPQTNTSNFFLLF